MIVQVGFAALAVPLWQLTHLASKTCWSAVSHGTPTARSREKPAETRLARGVVAWRSAGPAAIAWVRPGWMTVVAVRDSWQPPQKRDSPGPPENQTGSL